MKWLRFILDNAWTVIIIGGVLVQLIQAMRKKRAGGESPTGEPPTEHQFDDPDLAERTRKIREEIQRKIEQRTRGQAEMPAPAAEVEAPPPIPREIAVSRTPVHASSRLDAQRQAEILEEQATLMERLREAEFMKAAGKKRTEYEAMTADHAAEAQVATRSSVLGDLRNPVALRRAFVLREVLGPPVALR
jgi:hypothetical protein